ncbi:MAG: DUF131 domain-containing protein [Candidatus Bathyarchaeia archaeon]
MTEKVTFTAAAKCRFQRYPLAVPILFMFIINATPLNLERSGGKLLDLAIFYALGAALIVAGIIIIIAAIAAASTRGGQKGERKVKAAGIIMIGPIPIIFGTDKKSVKVVLALALALVVALIIAMVVFYWLLR